MSLLNTVCVRNAYFRLYSALIEKNRNTPKRSGKTHRHHVVPRHFYKYRDIPVDDSPSNIVNLSIRDHIYAHYYLAKCAKPKWFSQKNWYAVRKMLSSYPVSGIDEKFIARAKLNLSRSTRGSHNPAARKVYQYSLDGKYLRSFRTISEATRSVGELWGLSRISACCNGVNKSALGYIWSFKKSPRVEEYVNSKCVKVYKYSLDGELVKEYSSSVEAAKDTPGSDASAIAKCCKGIRHQTNYYLWSYEKRDNIKYNKGKTSKSPVDQYSLEGEYLKTYSSQHEAYRELGITHGNIGLCCQGKRKSSAGYIWRYKGETL